MPNKFSIIFICLDLKDIIISFQQIIWYHYCSYAVPSTWKANSGSLKLWEAWSAKVKERNPQIHQFQTQCSPTTMVEGHDWHARVGVGWFSPRWKLDAGGAPSGKKNTSSSVYECQPVYRGPSTTYNGVSRKAWYPKGMQLRTSMYAKSSINELNTLIIGQIAMDLWIA